MLAPFLAAIALLLAGCRSLPLASNAPPLPPLATNHLLAGDLVLTRSPAYLSAFFACHPVYHGPYSHAALYVPANDDAPPRLLHIHGDGVVVTELRPHLAEYAMIGVFRDRHVTAAHNPLAPIVASFVEGRHPEVGSAFNEDDPAATVHYTCVELVDSIYRQAGLAPPFPTTVTNPLDHWLAWYDHRTDTGLAGMPNANAALSSPTLQRLADWRNPRVNPLRLEVGDFAARQTLQRLSDGYELRPPPFGSRGLLDAISGCGCVGSRERRLAGMRVEYIRLCKRLLQGLALWQQRGQLPAAPAKRRQAMLDLYNAIAGDYLILPADARPRPLR